MKIENNKIYRSTNSGMVVQAVEDIRDSTFSGLVVFKGNNDYEVGSVVANLTSCIFELYESKPVKKPKPEYKHPTLFQIVTKYQSLGFNLDFDIEPYGGSLNCHITHLPTRTRPIKVSYNNKITENELVYKLLFNLSRISPQAEEDTRNIRTEREFRDIDREPITFR